MNAYPPALKEAAKNLLDNPDFSVLLKYRVNEIREDLEFSTETAEILKAHSELNTIKDFAHWIEHIGEGRING